MAKPIIGVTVDYSPATEKREFARGREVLYLKAAYVVPLEKVGCIPMALPIVDDRSLARQMVDSLDGLMLTGGSDLAPESYGEEPLEPRWAGEPRRTYFEFELIRAAREKKIPIFGICRGCQSLNVALGGSLIQDIPTQVKGAGLHRIPQANPYPQHNVTIREGTLLWKILGRERVTVSSSHHQAVKRVGEGLVVSAAAEDGIIEAIEMASDAFTLAVQWHPEEMLDDEVQMALFAAFGDAVRGRSLR